MSGNKTANINKVALFNMLGPIVLNGLSFFTMPVFTRLLGTVNYGLYTNYLSYYSILAVIIGFQAAGAIAPISVYYSGKERDRCFSNVTVMGLVSAAAIGLLIILFADPISAFSGLSKHMLLVLFLHATGQFVVTFVTSKFAYDKNSVANFLISVGISVVSIGLSLLLIYTLPEDISRYESYTYGHAVPYVIAGGALAAYMLLKGKSFFKGEYWKFTLALCLPLILHQLSNTLLHQCDKIMLKQMTDDSIVGIYGFAVVVANIMNIVWSALNTTFVPFYHDDIKADRRDALDKKVKNYTFLYTCLTVGFIMAMPEVVKLFGDEGFWGSIDVVPVLAVGFYFVFLYSFPVNFEFYHRKTKTIAIGTCFAAVANIAINYLLIPHFGMMGAAFATAVSYALLWIFHMVLARVFIKEEYHFRSKVYYPGLAATLGFAALFYVIKDMWYIRWPIFLCLAAAVLLKVIKQKAIF